MGLVAKRTVRGLSMSTQYCMMTKQTRNLLPIVIFVGEMCTAIVTMN